jgi:hypothetical protein
VLVDAVLGDGVGELAVEAHGSIMSPAVHEVQR